MKDPMRGRGYRPDIDGLRAVAVVAVVVFHVFPGVLPGGFSGVDVFFVISGYLISGLVWRELDAGTFTLVGFYKRRAIRLFPALAVVLTACLVAGWWLLLPGDYATLGKDAAAAAAYVSNVVFWRESGYFATPATLRPLTHLWSLAVEEQFYLVYPLLLILCLRRRVTAWALALLSAGSFAVNVVWTTNHSAAAFYLLPGRFWELALGGAVAWAQRSPRVALGSSLAWAANTVAAAGLALVVAGFIVITPAGFPGYQALIPTLGTAALIAAGERAAVNRFLEKSPIVLIGLFSYPLYLWHFPLLVFARLQTPGRNLSLALSIAVIVASVGLAYGTYRWVELPIRARRRRPSWRLASVVLAAALVAAGSGGALVAHAHGFAGRVPFPVQELTTYQYDYEPVYRVGTCFLAPDQGPGTFKPECVQKGRQPLVLLWGDSHAADLYPGLEQLERRWRFRIAEFAASSCPPLIGYTSSDRPKCPSVNAAIVSTIPRLHVAVALLSAAWDQYAAGDNAKLAATVAMLRRAHVGRIIVIGTRPKWHDGLPAALAQMYNHDPAAGIPTRVVYNGMPDPVRADAAMRKMARRLGVAFADPFRELCNRRGCLVRLGDTIDQLVIWDSSHFTAAGSDWVVGRLAPTLMRGLRHR